MWTNGLVQRESPTSTGCQWNNYGKKRKIEPKRVCEMELKKPRYKSAKKKSPLNSLDKKVFEPDTSESPSLTGLISKLYPFLPNACGFQYVDYNIQQNYLPEDEINLDHIVEIESTPSMPECIPEIVNQVETEVELMDRLANFSAIEVNIIEQETQGQGETESWMSQRTGRITASISHRIMTKVNTLQQSNDSSNISCTSLLETICHKHSSDKTIPALQYGIQMEVEAREAYTEELRKGKHKDFKVETCGLFVPTHKAFIGASPDALVSCMCCGNGLLEIKCPFSISHTKPSASNLSYLISDTKGKVTLSQSHLYYSQVQFQMGVTNREWCDFYIYTKHGSYLERITFDKVRWQRLCTAADYFFRKHIVPYLKYKKA